MPSRNTYHLTWVFLTLDVGYLGCSSKAQLLLITLDVGLLLSAAAPDLGRGGSFSQPLGNNLISGSSAFSKTSLNIWKFMVPVLLKPGLENFEHYFTSV